MSLTLLALALATAGAAGYRVRRSALARALKIAPPKNRWRRRWARVPGAEGHDLATQHFMPTARGPHPTILIRTPYGQGWAGGLPGLANDFFATLLVERGYHVIQQDVRGRFASTGTYVPFQFEREDGRATLRWIENQAWYNGRLGTFGQSYGGFVQWAIADDPAVQCMVPIQTSAEFGSIIHSDGTIALETALRFLSMMRIFGHEGAPGPLRGSIMMLRQTGIVRPPASTLPLREADIPLIGEADFSFREALDTPDLDSLFWQYVDHRERRDASQAPAMFVTGWLDPFLRESIADFQAVQAERSAYIISGPWTHGAISGTWLDEIFLFLAQHLRDEVPFERAPVRFAYMNVPGWQEATSWPPAPGATKTLFAMAAGELSVRPPTDKVSPTTFIFDPADPTPHLGGPLLDLTGAGMHDNAALEERSDVVTFTSEVLEQDLDLVGAPQVRLFATSSAKSTDFFLRLNHVDEAGKSTNVVDRILRFGVGELPVQGREIDLFPTAYRFPAGSRIRLLIASAAHPRYARNHGTGERQSTATVMTVQKQRIFHDVDRPTQIILPLARDD